MEINVRVQLDATPALTGCVNALISALSGNTPKQTKREQVKKVENASTPAPVEEEPAASAEPAVDEPVKDEPKEITDEELRAIVGPKTKDFGKDAVFTILGEFGVKRVPDLTQEQRAEFLEKLRAL